MPEVTLQETIKRLEDLVFAAELMHSPCIASLWLSEAKIILQALKEKTI